MVVSVVTVLVTMSRPGLAMHVLEVVLFRPIGAVVVVYDPLVLVML